MTIEIKKSQVEIKNIAENIENKLIKLSNQIVNRHLDNCVFNNSILIKLDAGGNFTLFDANGYVDRHDLIAYIKLSPLRTRTSMLEEVDKWGLDVFSDTMCVWYVDVFSQLLDKIVNLRNSYYNMVLSGCNTQSLFCGLITSDWGLYEDGVIRDGLSEYEKNCLSVWTDKGQSRMSCSFSLVALEEDMV